MPTYEYKCLGCDRQFDLVQKMSDDPIKECPECKSPVKRLIGTGAALIFKGSGFYCTDYRSESYQKGAEQAKKTDSSTADKKVDKKKEPASSPKSAGKVSE